MSPSLAHGEMLAEALCSELATVCERIAVAGSIRRRKPAVKDIELVLIPKWGERVITGQADMFGPNIERVNLTRERLLGLHDAEYINVIKPGTHEIIPWHINADGKYWRLLLVDTQVKVDVFIANPDTWGLLYMIRTGSGVGPDGLPQSGFAPAMLARWKAVSGGGWSESARLHDGAGHVVPTPEEQDVFDAIRVRLVPPEQRTSGRVVEANAIVGVRS